MLSAASASRRRDWRAAAAALALSALLVFAADAVVTGKLAWTPGGPALSFGRMLEDGIVKQYLDDHCPDASLRLCPYKDQLPEDADDFFWGGSVFDKLGRFEGLDDEMRRIALAALADYPLRQLTSMISETAQQLALVETGAGVVNWVWNTYDMIETYAPAAVPAMQAARQQRTGISFALINDLQVPLALFCMALLPLLAFVALRRKGFTDIGELNAAATLADPRQCRGVRRARHRASPLRRAHGLDRRARRPAHRHARRHAHRHAASPPACGTEIVTPQCASHFVLGEVRCISPAPRSWPNSRRPENCASPLRWRPRRRRNSPSRTATLIKRRGGHARHVRSPKRMGVPAEIIAHNGSGEIQNSAANNRWDVAFLPVDDERKKFVDFGNAYHLLQSTFLVAPGSKMKSVKDADAKGLGLGGVANTATFRAAIKATPNATHIEFAKVDAATAAMNEGRIEAIALSRESLAGLAGKIPGSRILDDAFLNSSTAVCMPKGKPRCA